MQKWVGFFLTGIFLLKIFRPESAKGGIIF